MLDFDYDYRQAYDHWDRCANDYCRCSRIENLIIEEVDVNTFYNEIVRIFKKEYEEISLQHLYCIDRLLSIHKVFDTSLWEVGITGGYYGEETSDASFAGKVDLFRDLNKVMSLDTDEAIIFILEREYGYVLPSLKDKTFTVYSLDLEEVHISNDRYFKSITEKSEAPSGIYGLLLDQHDKFKLIDGHHRYGVLMSKKTKDQVDYIVAEEK